MPAKFLPGTKVYLRRLSREDCGDQYLSFVNDVEILFFTEGVGYKPLDSADLEKYIELNNNPTSLLLGIFENNTDIHVGNIHLSHIKQYHNNCIFGIIMQRNYIGKGYAFEAASMLITHAFKVMNIHRIQMNVAEKNVGGIKLYEKLGAVKEGVLRESFYFDNRYHDMVVYSILKQEYLKNYPRRKE